MKCTTSASKIIKAEKKVEELKQEVKQQIEKLLVTDANLSELQENAKKMNDQAKIFQTNAEKLSRSIIMQYIIFVIVLISLLIGLVVCNSLLNKRTKKTL